MITKLSDLSTGGIYFLCFVKSAKFARKVRLIAFVNEKINFNSPRTELYLELIDRNKVISTNLVYACEIGIGETKGEAKSNYGKFDFEELSSAYDNLDKIKDDIKNEGSLPKL